MKHVGQVDIGAAPHESRGHYADDGAEFLIDAQRAANYAGVAAELALPELVAEERDRLGARHGVGCGGRTSDERRHAHYVEGVHGAMIASQALRLALAAPRDVTPGGSNH